MFMCKLKRIFHGTFGLTNKKRWLLIAVLFVCGFNHGSASAQKCFDSSFTGIYKEVKYLFPDNELYGVTIKDNLCLLDFVSPGTQKKKRYSAVLDEGIVNRILLLPEKNSDNGHSEESIIAESLCFAKAAATTVNLTKKSKKSIKDYSDLMVSLYLNRPSFDIINKEKSFESLHFKIITGSDKEDSTYTFDFTGENEHHVLSTTGVILSRIAENYGHFTLIDNLMVAEFYYLIKKITPILDSKKVLEIGAGNGVFSSAIRKIINNRELCQTVRSPVNSSSTDMEYHASDDFSDHNVKRQREHMRRNGIPHSVVSQTANETFKNHPDARFIVAFNPESDVFPEIFLTARLRPGGATGGATMVLMNSSNDYDEYYRILTENGGFDNYNLKLYRLPFQYPNFPHDNHYVYLVYINAKDVPEKVLLKHDAYIENVIIQMGKIDKKYRKTGTRRVPGTAKTEL